MTTNQTIDGVPRELIERITNPFGDVHDKFNAIQELRALLDAESPPCAKSQVEPAAQPQGAPVVLTNAQRRAADYKEQQAFNDWSWNKEGEAIGRMDGQAAAIEAWHARAKLAEQPAPVAVDETAEFSKWTHEVIAESRIGGVTLKVQRVQHLTPSEEKSAHDAWMARAAMNAKSR